MHGWRRPCACCLPTLACFFCLHGMLLGSFSVLLLQCVAQAFASMSDAEATVLDTDEDPVGADLVAADRLFAAEEFFLPIATLSGLSSSVAVQCRPADVEPHSPQGLLYVAAYANHVQALICPAKRKRQAKGKDYHFYLQRLQRDPSGDTGFVQAGKLGARTRKAHLEFMYWLRRVSFKNRAEARSMMPQRLFRLELPHIRSSWELLACIAEDIYEPMAAGNSKTQLVRTVVAHLRHKLPDEGVKADGVGKTPLPFRCSALFCTWFLDLGPESVQVLAGIAAGQGRAELAVLFRQSKAHVDAFADFTAFAAGVVSVIGARTHGTGMEVGICTSANTPAQCHLHLFASTANVEGGFVNAEVNLMVVDPQKLSFRGKAPQHLSSSKVHKGYRAGTTVQKAMYYLLADKVGSIFQHGNAKPFQDCGPVGVVVLIFSSSASCCLSLHLMLHCCCGFCTSVLCSSIVVCCTYVVFCGW